MDNNLQATPFDPPADSAGGRWLRVAAWMLGVMAIILLLMGTLLRDSISVLPAQQFNPVTVIRGSYVYLDVTGISDPLSAGGSGGARFFSAEDAGGYLYIVRTETSEFERMKLQNDWWKTRSGEEQPVAYRLYGSSVQMNAEERSRVAAALGLDEKRVEDYFGQKYLDTTRAPLSLFHIGLIILGVIMLIFSLFILVFSRTNASRGKSG